MKLTQREMAKLFDITQGTVSKIEREELTPNSETILKILRKENKLK